MRLRIRELVDMVAGIAMIVASAVIVMALLGVVGGGRDATSVSRHPYAAGDEFPDVLNAPGRPVAILWLSSRCRYCEESMPFYRRTVETQGADAVVVMGTEPEDRLREYVSKHGLAGVRVKSLPPGQLKFSATPALLLLDANRRVSRVWVGKVPNKAEDEILAALARLRAGIS